MAGSYKFDAKSEVFETEPRVYANITGTSTTTKCRDTKTIL